ncbi:MAG: dTMP kinase [Tatlockia sp.]|nr:dTMP kinase [Tatlockia sp.]
MSERGCFIVVEGLEGAGKSTAIETIKLYLKNIAPELILTREPGGTRVGEIIRSMLKDKIEGETLDARSELLLFYAARIQLVEEIIRPALKRGAWVLADRFELSTFAYQGWGRGLDIEIIEQLSTFGLESFSPDLIFYLDIDPEQGLQRVNQRGETDRIEQESLTFFTKVRQGYLTMIRTMENVVTINASQNVDLVKDEILTQLKQFNAAHANN